MNKTDKDFLDGMWDKVRVKQADMQLCQAVEEDLATGSKTDMMSFIRDAYSGIGIRQLLFGMSDCLVVVLFITLIIFYVCYHVAGNSIDTIYSIAFLSAPCLYGFFFLLGWQKEKQSNSYGVLMSCKYTFFHVLAARMLLAGVAGVGFNLAYLLLLIVKYPVELPRLIVISFTSLMLFSMLFAAAIQKGKNIRNALIVVGVWMALNLIAAFNMPALYQGFLMHIPLLALFMAGAAAMLFWMYGLYHMTTLSFRKKEYINA